MQCQEFKVNWLKYGDRNTFFFFFFHAAAIILVRVEETIFIVLSFVVEDSRWI